MRIAQPVLIFSCLVVALFTIFGCSPKVISLTAVDQLASDDYQEWDHWENLPRQIEYNWERRTIRTAVHYFDTADSSKHWDRDYAIKYASVLVRSASDRFGSNVQMNLPEGNITPVLNANIKVDLDLSNVYFHYTDTDCYFIKKGPKSNRQNKKMTRPYVQGDETMIHIFIMPFHPEEIASGRQRLESTGIALDNVIKLAGMYEQEKAAWDYAGLLAHEVGHVLGLQHSWNRGDGCKDTPRNANCWNTTEDAPCDGVISNNLMDYNVSQRAITPCQISIMHASMSNPAKTASRVTEPLPCTNSSKTNWVIADKQKWDQAVMIPGDITIEKGGALYLSNYISTASDAKIIIKKGGTLLLDRPVFMTRCAEESISVTMHRGARVYSRKKATILSGNPLH